MKKITKTFEVYSLEELKEIDNETYEKELEKLRDSLLETRFYFLEEDFKNILVDKYKLSYDFTLNYSLSNCQGDGVCFYSNKTPLLRYNFLSIDIKRLNVFEKHAKEHLNEAQKGYLKEYLNSGYNFTIIKTDYRYEHKYTCKIDYQDYWNDNKELEEKINDFIYQFSKDLLMIYRDICDDLEEFGYSLYDISDDDILEYARNNDYEYEREEK